MSPPPKLSRRTLTIGGIAAAGAAIVAGAIYEVPKLFKHRAQGEYAELVNTLDDPAQAALVGAVLPIGMDAAPLGSSRTYADMAGEDLKKRLSKATLPELLAADCARIDRMVEAGGWVIPITLAEFCVLAARSI